jgi:excisionase family DNA binding protein
MRRTPTGRSRAFVESVYVRQAFMRRTFVRQAFMRRNDTRVVDGVGMLSVLTVVDEVHGCGVGQRKGTDVIAEHQLLTVREVAAMMRVSTMTVYRLIKAGELGAIRVGQHFRIRPRDLETYLDAQAIGPAASAPDSGEPASAGIEARTDAPEGSIA